MFEEGAFDAKAYKLGRREFSYRLAEFGFLMQRHTMQPETESP